MKIKKILFVLTTSVLLCSCNTDVNNGGDTPGPDVNPEPDSGVRTTWSEEEKQILNTHFGSGVDEILPCYAYGEITLTDNFTDYGCVSFVATDVTSEEKITIFENYVENFGFSLYENYAHFNFKYVLDNKYLAGIDCYLDPLSDNAFTIDYYVSELDSTTQFVENWSNEDKTTIDTYFTESITDVFPCYLPTTYEIVGEENSVDIYALGTTSYFENYINKIKASGFEEKSDEYGDFLGKSLNDGYLYVTPTYFADGSCVFNLYYEGNNQGGDTVDTLRTEWTSEEIALFDKYYFNGISEFIPCIGTDDTFLNDFSYETFEVLVLEYYKTEDTAFEALIEEKLVSANYVKDFDEYGDTYYTYTFEDGTYLAISVFYLDNYLEADFYYNANGTVGGDDNITGDITITDSDFAPSYSSEEIRNLSGMNATVNYVLQGSGKATDGTEYYMQFKKYKEGSDQNGWIANNNQLPEINSITINKVLIGFEAGDSCFLSVYKSLDGIDYTKVDLVDNVAKLDGATYFKIVNENPYAQYVSTIVIDFINL